MNKGRLVKRIALACGAAVCIIIVSSIAWIEAGSWITSRRLEAAQARWTSAINAGVKVGQSRADAEGWFRKSFPEQGKNTDFFDEYNQKLIAVGETVDVVGLGFPCSSWMVFVEANLTEAGRVSSRGITTSGMCV